MSGDLSGLRLPSAVLGLLAMANSGASGIEAQLALTILAIGPNAVEHDIARLTPSLGLSDPRLKRLADAAAEAKRAFEDRNKRVAKQHTTSQVLLANFCTILTRRDGPQLISFEKKYGKWEPKSTAAVAYIADFVSVDSARVESIWSKSEAHLGQAIQVATNGGLNSDPAATATIRDAIALHIARNPATRDIHDDLFGTLIPFKIEDLLARQELWPLALEAYGRETGIGIVTTDQAILRKGAELFYANVKRTGEEGYTYRFRVESNFRNMQQFFATRQLEVFSISASSPDQFVITDAGALPIDLTADKVGWDEGVGIANAEKIILPLSPRVLVAIGPSSGTFTTDGSFVDQVNRLQVRAARHRVLFHPSALGNLPSKSSIAEHSTGAAGLPPSVRLLIR